jgi:hypothetical protein
VLAGASGSSEAWSGNDGLAMAMAMARPGLLVATEVSAASATATKLHKLQTEDIMISIYRSCCCTVLYEFLEMGTRRVIAASVVSAVIGAFSHFLFSRTTACLRSLVDDATDQTFHSNPPAPVTVNNPTPTGNMTGCIPASQTDWLVPGKCCEPLSPPFIDLARRHVTDKVFVNTSAHIGGHAYDPMCAWALVIALLSFYSRDFVATALRRPATSSADTMQPRRAIS